jgi:outer membrane protein OmpA-like peptidoglycan-associated protein
LPYNVDKILMSASQKITFTGRQATPSKQSYAALDQVFTLLNENPGMRIRVEGHTDNIGEEYANEILSLDRAKAVESYLVNKGIDEERIMTEGFGENMPVASNSTAAGRAKNNRVEIKLGY